MIPKLVTILDRPSYYTRKDLTCTAFQEGSVMKTFDIILRSVADVRDFVSLACEKPFEVLVGTDRRSVNGKSFMQIFCLDLAGALQVKMDCSDDQFRSFFEEAAPFRM